MREKVPNPFGKLSIQNLGSAVRTLLFFILIYLYLWLEVDLRLIYHGGGMITNFPVFYRGWTFFRPFLSYPGGPVEYVCAFLSQFFYISWAGAIVVTAQAWLICLCTGYILKAIGASALRLLRFVPPVLVLITYTQYTYHFLMTTALLTSLLFVCLYIRIAQRSKPFCLVSFLVLSVILYYIAGGAYLLFALVCTIYELFFALRWRMALAYLLSAAVIPYIEGTVILGIGPGDAYSELLPYSWAIISYEERRRLIMLVYIMYLLLPLTALLWRLGAACMGSFFAGKRDGKLFKAGSTIFSRYASTPALGWAVESCLLFVLAAAIVLFSQNKKQKTVLEVDYYACYQMWPQLLRAAPHQANDLFITHAVNRALYQTGRLGSEMFSYPQNPNALLLTLKMQPLVRWRGLDICIELGFLNRAEGYLAELLEGLGQRPIILKRLALINMAKENPGAARIYLNALSKTLFHAGWADDYLARLQSDPGLSTDDRIQHLRRVRVKTEDDNIVGALLWNSRQDQTAFEYLMAYYLLTRQLDRFISNLDGLDVFDYSQIPRHYEEAILVYTSLTKRKAGLHGRQISRESIQRFKNFFQIYDSFGEDKQAAFKVLAADYGDSYLLYYIHQRSGTRK
jgi:hypothetical protein